jgi:hypothetical protein
MIALLALDCSCVCAAVLASVKRIGIPIGLG